MLVIGLTGGIGSGKSTVASLFQEQGVTVIDTDQLAREVTELGEPALEEIKNEFGEKILQDKGNLNRNALRKIIFNDDKKRRWLEELLHPLIRAKLKNKIKKATSPYCIVVIPLLFETKPNPLINRILVVDAEESDQIKRTQLRDNVSLEEVKAILNTQVRRAIRISSANEIIENKGSIEDLKSEVKRLHSFYTAIAQKNTFK